MPKRRKRRKPVELGESSVLFIRSDPKLNKSLIAHAKRCGVSKNAFSEDVLRLWVLSISNWDDPAFAGCRPDPVPLSERPAGYLELIGA